MPIKLLLPAALVAAALPTLSVSAGAQGAGLLSTAIFDRADANRDGYVTKSEIQAARARMFDAIDTNGDGLITPAEVEAGKSRLKERAARRLAKLAERKAKMPATGDRLAALDRNKDGKITRDEFVSGATPWFDRLDRDGKGVSKAEFEAFLASNR